MYHTQARYLLNLLCPCTATSGTTIADKTTPLHAMESATAVALVLKVRVHVHLHFEQYVLYIHVGINIYTCMYMYVRALV